MYGILAGIWNLLAGSKSISDLKTGGLIPPYRSLKEMNLRVVQYIGCIAMDENSLN